jgi:hypothetical protein
MAFAARHCLRRPTFRLFGRTFSASYFNGGADYVRPCVGMAIPNATAVNVTLRPTSSPSSAFNKETSRVDHALCLFRFRFARRGPRPSPPPAAQVPVSPLSRANLWPNGLTGCPMTKPSALPFRASFGPWQDGQITGPVNFSVLGQIYSSPAMADLPPLPRWQPHRWPRRIGAAGGTQFLP